ncbi:MAG: type I restriction enzyme HsdR N-terminal domain-containing protein [Parachlamydiaceae bacterium]|nr:type I restriction enzyme HsdR N-terminal domain-containing protein [Parachlamydiaceae bacterium]
MSLYCPIRNKSVANLPEERVRVHFLNYLITEKGFPKASFVLEQQLSQMPHLNLQEQKIPNRRADIICFGKNIHPEHEFFPLLLIECKAVKLTKRTMNQLMGYNHFLQAYFIAAVNDHEVQFAWFDEVSQQHQFAKEIPAYSALRGAVVSLSVPVPVPDS